MSEEKKESEVDAKSTEDKSAEKDVKSESPKEVDDSKTESAAKAAEEAESAAKAAEEAESAAKAAIAKAEAAKKAAEAAAEVEYKAIAAEVKADAAKAPDFTFKRQGEEIFRREMGEPEFFLDKKDRFPRPILTAEEEASITREAEIPHDQTPSYTPEHVLSPEYGGVSNYERGVDDFIEEANQRLEKLRNDPEATKKQIKDAENDIIYLKSLHENFFIGMNVFRTAKGGRDKIKS